MSYLMNLGDRFTSHQYVSVYWGQLANSLKLVFPSLGVRLTSSSEVMVDDLSERVNECEVSFEDVS